MQGNRKYVLYCRLFWFSTYNEPALSLTAFNFLPSVVFADGIYLFDRWDWDRSGLGTICFRVALLLYS